MTDVRGYVAELLAKAVNRNALDDVLSVEDKERVLAMLVGFGGLGKEDHLCDLHHSATVLKDVPSDFSPETQAALEGMEFVEAVKVGFQARRCFWEEDEAIYGGIERAARGRG